MTYPIPDKALAAHIAILGKAGSGKTTAAKGLVERVLDADGRACVIDPTGVWHGLRTSADGKRAGYPVVIFGGEHGDFPLASTHGEALAEIVATSSTPAIIDTSLMRVGERTRFFADFGEALLRKNKGPLHLVIDEAHLFAPQGRVNDPQSGAMLHAANNMVSLGRSRGLRIVLISQRPAKLHKDSLTQAETLVAMRLVAPQDRKAIEAWIEDNADEKKAREILSSLASLKTGQAWLWAPVLDVLERVTFPRIKTLDTSAAPTGEEVSARVLAPIDRDVIAGKLKAVAIEADANDPKKLRAQIADLRSQVIAKTAGYPQTELFEERRKAQAAGEAVGLAQGRAEVALMAGSAMNELAEAAKRAVDQSITETIDAFMRRVTVSQPAQSAPVPRGTLKVGTPVSGVGLRNGSRLIARSSDDPDGPLKGVARAPTYDAQEPPSVRKILDAIHSSYPVSLSFEAAARRAGISSRSSAFGKYRTAIAASPELVDTGSGGYRSRPEYARGGTIDAGATLQQWVAKLPPSYGKMLQAVHDHGPAGREDIAAAAGVSITSSGLGAGLKELMSLQLIREDRRGWYELEEGLR
jgi:hypothetical protein